jgi:FHA domain
MEAALTSSYGRSPLGSAPFKIGRASDNALVITDPQSSARHAEIAPGYGGNGYQVTDLNSTNGTFINEQRLAPNSPRPLNNGDVIRIGNTLFTYEVSDGYAPTIAASSPNYEPTVAASPGMFTPPQPQPGAYGNFNSSPQQPPVTPPAFAPQAYPQPPVYPQNQPAYPQPAYPQQAYPQPPAYPQNQPAYPQPAYPQQGGQPGYPQKKRGCGVVVLIVVILLVLVAGGGGAYYYFQLRATPQKTLAAYCDGWKTSNAQELYDQLDTKQQGKTSVNDVKQALGLLAILGGIKDCQVGTVQQNGSTATGVITLTFGDGKTETVTDTLIQENGAWKIDAESSKVNS